MPGSTRGRTSTGSALTALATAAASPAVPARLSAGRAGDPVSSGSPDAAETARAPGTTLTGECAARSAIAATAANSGIGATRPGLAGQGSVVAGKTRSAVTTRPAVTAIAGQPAVTADTTVTAGAAARPSGAACAAVASRAFLATSAVTARAAPAAFDDDVTGTDGADRRGAASARTASGSARRAPGRIENNAGSTGTTHPAVAARRTDRGERIGGGVVAVPAPPTSAGQADATGSAIESCARIRSACGTAFAADT